MIVFVAVMLTIALVGLIGFSNSEGARHGRPATTTTKMRSLKNALESYNRDYGTYPDQLSVLWTMKPPLIVKIGGQDGWKRPFIYRYPNMSGDPERPFDLVSTGKSGVVGARDNINLWTMDERDN